ncbi:MAG: 50S ribosomal protein L17 [Epulopiscium sp.]|nr:50S ribosomal protein L17 [Candidatus Epulonipiscium sp.]
MARYRKLGRESSQRQALLRNQVTNLLYHGSIRTTDTKAKEVRKIAESLVALAVKERDNYDEVKVTTRVPRKDAQGNRIKEEVNGKKVTVFDEVEKTIKKDQPSRLHARRQMLRVLYPVTETPKPGTKQKRANTKQINMVDKLFDEIAPKYTNRNGGYTRIIKIGPRKGDGAEQVIIELV